MRQKWRPQIKPCVVLRGNEYTDFLFLKNTKVDSPFTHVKFFLGVSIWTAPKYCKWYFEAVKILTLYPHPKLIIIDQFY